MKRTANSLCALNYSSFWITAENRMRMHGGSERSRDSDGVPMGLRPTKSDEGAADGWRGINDLRRVFNRAVG